MSSHAPETVRDTVPLCVSLDGALINSDVLSEGIVRLLRDSVRNCFLIPWWRLRGHAELARQVEQRTNWDSTVLPDNEEFLAWLREQQHSGRHLVLCACVSQPVGARIAARYDLFDEVITYSCADTTGRALSERLVARFGEGRFDYAGHETQDLAAWGRARRAIVVAPGWRLRRQLGDIGPVARSFPTRPAGIRAWLRALRLHQWAKNVLMFLPVAAAHKLLFPVEAFLSLVAFGIFGMCASGTYLLNDLTDIDSDRIHPTKRHRPFAAGALSLTGGLLLAVGLIVSGMALAAVLLGWKYLVTLIGYVIATLWYSRSLKRIPMVDVLTLAALYALRVIAGAAATDIVPSFWLLAFTMFLFLSLAVAKRYSELKLMMKSGRTETAGRGYTTDDVSLLQSSGLSSGYIAVLVMALYVNSDVAQGMYSHPKFLWLLCPLLLYWITRVWIKTSRGQMDEDPVIFALRDRPSLSVATAAAILIVAAA
jgi:4-hydroxybenzoate polyprenyltransferase